MNYCNILNYAVESLQKTMGSSFNINDIILVLALAGCFLITAFSQLIPSRRKLVSDLLTAYFLCLFFYLLGLELLWNNGLSDLRQAVSPLVVILAVTPSLLVGPFQLAYLHSYVNKDFSLRRRHWIHLMPALLLPLLMLIFGMRSSDLLPEFSGAPVDVFIWTLLKAYPLGYSLVGIYVFIDNRKFTNLDSHSEFAIGLWLATLVFGFTIYWAWVMLVHVLGLLGSLDINLLNSLGAIGNYICFALIVALLNMALVYVFKVIKKGVKQKNVSNPVRVPSGCISKIEGAILSDKLYRNKNLTLDDFSKVVGHPKKVVSAAIKDNFQMNFNQFVNRYRIADAKEMLDSVEFQEITIAEIYYKAGFNSKSAFQRIFRESEEMSPSEYRLRVVKGRGSNSLSN